MSTSCSVSSEVAPAGQSPRMGSRSIASQLIAEGGCPSHGTPSASPAAYASTPALTRAEVEPAGRSVTHQLHDMPVGLFNCRHVRPPPRAVDRTLVQPANGFIATYRVRSVPRVVTTLSLVGGDIGEHTATTMDGNRRSEASLRQQATRRDTTTRTVNPSA